jgi:hypothetical protein
MMQQHINNNDAHRLLVSITKLADTYTQLKQKWYRFAIDSDRALKPNLHVNSYKGAF